MRITISELTVSRVPRIVLAVLVTGLLAAAGALPAQAPVSGLDSIRAQELRVKIEHLASDAFQGRGNGTPELDEAADFIAGVFRENGLSPAGNNGFFQEFRIERLSLGNNVLSVSGARDIRLDRGRDYIPFTESIDGAAEGGMVFAGYGIRAPALGYDDLEGVALDGRIAVVLDGYPRADDADSPFGALSNQDYSSIRWKAANVESAGAIGLIVVQGSASRGGVAVEYLAGVLRSGLPPRRSVMELAPGPGDPQIPIAIVSRDASTRIVPDLGALERAIDERLDPATAPIAGTVTLRIDLDRDGYTARNVIARVEGSDPDLKDELVVVGAHYDHDGADGGRIWNGADDNASGTSALLELAEAFSAGVGPARSMLLAAWAGEEKGMLGSRHFVQDPATPLEATVAMIQLDMIGRNEEHGPDREEGFLSERAEDNANAINAIGSAFSADMRDVFERVNTQVGLDLRFRYDYRAQNLIRRSDHWSFLSRRIPAIFLFGGLHPDYHTPNDTAEKINYSKVEKVARLTYLAILDIANAAERPRFINP